MLSDEQSFLRAIDANFADDLPRLVYADWLDEQGNSLRAEFIRLQCEIARLETQTREVVDANYKLWLRQQELLDIGEDQFSVLTPIVKTRNTSHIEFYRGFCSEVRLPLDDFLLVDDQISGILPRFRLSVTGVSRDPIGFLSARSLECITAISVSDPRLTWPSLMSLDDSSVYSHLMASLPRLGRLEQLDLSSADLFDETLRILELGAFPALTDLRLGFNQITDAGLIYLLNLGLLHQLKIVDLSYNPLTDQAAIELADRLGRSQKLKHLILRHTNIQRAGQQALLLRFGSRVDLF